MVFIFICIFIIIISIILYSSKIRIEIVNLKFSSQSKRHINKNYRVIIKLCILGVIPILKLNITKTKLKRIKLKEKIKNIDFKILQKNPKLDKEIFKVIKQANISIKNINLHIDLGTENASFTAILIPTISTIIAILLNKRIKKFENQIFIVKPIYQNQNLLNIYISGIFEIKMSHIINIINILKRKEKKGVKEYERTSNRRSYDYSYE